MANVDGYSVVYTHRGSWKANRSYAGKVIDQVPVAWDRDYLAGVPPTLLIWFQDADEASRLQHIGAEFVAALAKKKPDGASSSDISRLFKVLPLEILKHKEDAGRLGLRCHVVGKVDAP